MTWQERLELSRRIQAERERLKAQARRLVKRECSRCRRAVEPCELSPGRVWCRPCEAKRKKRMRDAAKAAA